MKNDSFCVHFVSPIKTKSVPERDAFCFATRILLQVFFVQEFCYKYFSYKFFATSVFAGKSFATSVVIQLFYIQEFCKVPSKLKTVFATSVFSHTASFICCKAHFISFNAMQQYQPKSRQRFSLCKGVSGLAESAKHLCKASVTLLLNFVFLYGCITNLYVYCDALSLTKQFVFL